MSWSYNPEGLKDSIKDQVRLRIGDTIQEEPLLEDEEIQFYIDSCNHDLTRAAYQCVSVIITRICSTPDYTLGPYSESNSNRLKAFHSVKAELSSSLIGYNAPIAKSPTTGPIFAYDMMSVQCCTPKEESDE